MSHTVVMYDMFLHYDELQFILGLSCIHCPEILTRAMLFLQMYNKSLGLSGGWGNR